VKRILGPVFYYGIVLAAILWFYCWTALTSTEHLSFKGSGHEYYNLLADGFLQGHLFIAMQPDEKLLKLADPYDPSQNENFRANGYQDLTLYKGKLYLYFGVVPALVFFIPCITLLHAYPSQGLAMVVFLFGGLFLAFCNARISGNRCCRTPPGPWLYAVILLILGLSDYGPFILRRPDVYEVAISSGYCFSMLGLCGFLRAALAADDRQKRWLMLMGTGMGLAVGCRPFYIFAMAVLLPFYLLIRRRQAGATPLFSLCRELAWAVAPFSFLVLCVLYYNYSRFDNPLDFGQMNQLGVDFVKGDMKVFSFTYLPMNLYSFLFSLPHLSAHFPFVLRVGETFDPTPVGWRRLEMVFGLVPSIPFLLILAVYPGICALRRNKPPEDAPRQSALPVVLALLAAGFSMLCFISTQYAASMRYLVDVQAWFLLAAALAWCVLDEQWAREHPHARRFLTVAMIALALWGVGIHLAASISGYYESLKNFHPEIYNRLGAFF
jgi:hypothetical protein